MLALRPDQFFLSSRDPLEPALLLWAWAVWLTAALGAVTDEYSWVDRIWSIAPWVYVWVFALHPTMVLGEADKGATDFDGLLPFPVSRLTLVAVLATLWCVPPTTGMRQKSGCWIAMFT